MEKLGRAIDMVGHKFGKLTVYRKAGNHSSGSAEWWCDCECGGKIRVHGGQLRSGKYKSCGCVKKERQATYRANVRRGIQVFERVCVQMAMKGKRNDRAS